MMPRSSLLVILAAIGAAPAARADAPPPLTPEQVERVVHDYLLREPEIVYEAIQGLQRRQAVQAAEKTKGAIAAERAAILDAAGPAVGPADAKVTLVEFFDYRCGYCRGMLAAVRSLLAENPDVRVVLKDYPILGPDSVTAARAALASRLQRPEAYWEFHQALMGAADLSEPAVLGIARRMGLDADRLRRDMAGPEVGAWIDADVGLARRLGVEGTPAFVLGDRLLAGAIGGAGLAGLVDEARRACAASAAAC